MAEEMGGTNPPVTPMIARDWWSRRGLASRSRPTRWRRGRASSRTPRPVQAGGMSRRVRPTRARNDPSIWIAPDRDPGAAQAHRERPENLGVAPWVSPVRPRAPGAVHGDRLRSQRVWWHAELGGMVGLERGDRRQIQAAALGSADSEEPLMLPLAPGADGQSHHCGRSARGVASAGHPYVKSAARSWLRARGQEADFDFARMVRRSDRWSTAGSRSMGCACTWTRRWHPCGRTTAWSRYSGCPSGGPGHIDPALVRPPGSSGQRRHRPPR